MVNIKLITLTIIGLPLFAAVVVGLFGKTVGRKGAHVLTTTAVGLSFLLSFYLFVGFYQETLQPLNFKLYTWGKIGDYAFNMGFLIDELTVLMLAVVTFVSWMVHVYTIGYMADDEGYIRFFSYISLFTFGMLTLVSANNFLQLFFGWEMVGLMSYLLIGFWFQKESAITASLKAFIVNRVGDFGFIIGLAALLYCFGTLEYYEVFQRVALISPQAVFTLTPQFSCSMLSFICIALFIGAMGKSAQIPLHVWLPDSMEGPTPISALIHAATMVTAGVFMVARLSPLFEQSEATLVMVLIVGTLTTLLMGLVGIVQNDIKRIIAYSTLSQLGYMMVAMGVSAYSIGIFHLVTHAFFKALLFLGAGTVIIALHHEQDIWRMGNLKRALPITYYTMLVGSLALIGFPFFSGFYSKDLIIAAVKLSSLPGADVAYWVVLGSVFITALYTFRLFFVVFLRRNGEQVSALKKEIPHLKTPAVMWIPLVLLSIPAFFSGIILAEPLLHNYFKHSLVLTPEHQGILQTLASEVVEPWHMGLEGLRSLPCWLGLLGVFFAWLVYIKWPASSKHIKIKVGIFYQILNDKFGFDRLYQAVLVGPARQLGSVLWRVSDDFMIDGIVVNGTASVVQRLSMKVRKLQTGYLYHYAFVMILGFLGLILWVLFSEKLL